MELDTKQHFSVTREKQHFLLLLRANELAALTESCAFEARDFFSVDVKFCKTVFRRQFENVADSSLPDFGVNVKKNESEDRVNAHFYKKFKNQKKLVIFFSRELQETRLSLF